jgi:hypothetical protein
MGSEVHPLRMLACTAPKKGHRPEENEDAYAASLARGRFAIADGASESSDAGAWARLLVDDFVETGSVLGSAWFDAQSLLQARWEASLGDHALPWYAELKREEGAFATFLGLAIDGNRWQAVAVGDTCVFHVRGQQFCKAFPVEHWTAFCSTPHLIGSRNHKAQSWSEHAVYCEGDFLPGDALWLMTDAMAAWFLKTADAGQRPWELLEGLFGLADAPTSFADWTRAARESGEVRNDDMTMVGVIR